MDVIIRNKSIVYVLLLWCFVSCMCKKETIKDINGNINFDSPNLYNVAWNKEFISNIDRKNIYSKLTQDKSKIILSCYEKSYYST